jgi:hypothetical protein
MLAWSTLALPAAAQDFPKRKPGLWTVNLTLPGGRPGPGTMRMCIDAKTDAAMMQSGANTAQSKCSRHDIQHTGDQYVMDSVCSAGDRTVTSHAVITTTGDSAFHADITSQVTPPMQGQPADMHMTQTGAWSGPCPADMQPGEMMMPNGMKVNVLSMANRP